MGHTRASILMLSCVILGMMGKTLSQKSDFIITKYRDEIEKYVMKGHGRGWKACNIVHDKSKPIGYNLFDDTPTYVIDMDNLDTFDIQKTFSSSHCLLISAHIRSNQSLSDLIEFGWSVIQRKRLALAISLSPGLTLHMATNTTKLPFLVAARMEGETEQFLCPVIGVANPQPQSSICQESYAFYKDKSLRVGTFGIPPSFYGELLATYKYKFFVLNLKFYCSCR